MLLLQSIHVDLSVYTLCAYRNVQLLIGTHIAFHIDDAFLVVLNSGRFSRVSFKLPPFSTVAEELQFRPFMC